MAVSDQEFRLLKERVALVERRLSDVESGFGETLYRMERRLVRSELRFERVLARLGLDDVAETDVDARIEEDL